MSTPDLTVTIHVDCPIVGSGIAAIGTVQPSIGKVLVWRAL